MLALGSVGTQAATGLVTTINWYNIDAYCTFMRAGNVFIYDDPSTWDFVFLSQRAEDDGASGYVSINERLIQLERLNGAASTDGGIWTYRSLDAAASYDVVLTLQITDRWTENTEYQGELKVVGAEGSESLMIEGGCGV